MARVKIRKECFSRFYADINSSHIIRNLQETFTKPLMALMSRFDIFKAILYTVVEIVFLLYVWCKFPQLICVMFVLLWVFCKQVLAFIVFRCQINKRKTHIYMYLIKSITKSMHKNLTE